jgi:pyruvate dehydrogenase E2 component (dihydrolipoamide acetyltransferase)
MIVEIRMPEVAADMTEADIVDWLAAPGDRITQGEILFEIETDKATVEIEAPATGVLSEIRVPAGTTGVAVGEWLATMESSEEAEPSDASASTSSSTSADTPLEAAAPEPTVGRSESSELEPRSEPEATALARRIAQRAGVDVDKIKGSGVRGRVLRADVENSLTTERSAAFASPDKSAAPSRDVRSARTDSAGLIHLGTACRFDRIMVVIEKLNTGREDEPISYSSALTRAVAFALSQLPEIKTKSDDETSTDSPTHVSVSEGSDSPPILIRGAERMGLGAICAALSSDPSDVAGTHQDQGEIGLFHALESGVDRVEALLGPGQICAFTVGQINETPVMEKGELVAGTVVEINLCADPLVFSRETATRLLSAVRQSLESPLQMAL